MSALTNSNTLLETLIAYVDRGFTVLPLHGIDKDGNCTCSAGSDCDKSQGKHPNTANGYQGATRDTRIIREWAKQYPRGNWGARTGVPVQEGKYLVVVDVDPRNGGDLTLAQIQGEIGALPATWTQETGGNGNHYLFYSDSPVESGVLGPGIEILAAKKYFVISPSKHVSGGEYSWALGLSPTDIPIARVPNWVLEYVEHASGDRPERDGERTAEDTILGEAFKRAGMLGPQLPNGNHAVCCPWAAQHSDNRGRGQDSSTVILPPAGGSNFGGFKCYHSHCTSRKWQDVMSALPEEATAAAKRKYPPKLIRVPDGGLPEPKPSKIPKSDYERQMAECEERLAFKQLKNSSKIICDTINVITVLTYDPRWRGILWHDDFSHRVCLNREPLWNEDDAPRVKSPYITDTYLNCIDVWLRREWGLEVDMQKIMQAVDIVSKRDSVNPLQNYLDALKWDGTKRVDKWLHNYLGCEDTPYHSVAGRKWLISAVARAYEPGCKADHVLILEGDQGRGKSTALSVLAGKNWFSDTPIDVGNKDAYIALQGKWIIELGELTALKRSDVDRIKAFFSSPSDFFRPPFGKTNQEFPRACVFAGTVNPESYLTDPTGNRRFWPARCGIIDIETLREDRTQIWAEVVAIYKAWVNRGSLVEECLWWPSYEERDLFQNEQAARVIADSAWEEVIGRWLNGERANALIRADGYVSQTVILREALNIDPREQGGKEEARLGRVMSDLGWNKSRVRVGNMRLLAYKPSNSATAR